MNLLYKYWNTRDELDFLPKAPAAVLRRYTTLQAAVLRLTDWRSLFDLVPFIRKREREDIAARIAGRNISIIFDGTCYLGEALCIVARYVTDDLSIELIALRMLQKSLTGEEIARELISTLSVEYHVTTTALLACMRDRAATNNVALRTLKSRLPQHC